MPELPEVETIRQGLNRHLTEQTIQEVHIVDDRSLKHDKPQEFRHNLLAKKLLAPQRRGKFLWFPLVDHTLNACCGTTRQAETAMLIHLGMSGQTLITNDEAPQEKHLKILFAFKKTTQQLRFIDQRIFGYISFEKLVADTVSPDRKIPARAAHIAADPLEEIFDIKQLVTMLHQSKRAIKRLLLDQRVVSGIGNIYADEALWDAKIHYNTPAHTLSLQQLTRLVEVAQNVLQRAIQAGGTSFDSLYVSTNGNSGYFSRSLNAYQQEGRPCPRPHHVDVSTRHDVTVVIQRDAFMNRSSFYCPQCQSRASSNASA